MRGAILVLLLSTTLAGCLQDPYQDRFGSTFQRGEEARAAVATALARREVYTPRDEPSASAVETQASNVRNLAQNHRAWEAPPAWRAAHVKLGSALDLELASFGDAVRCLLSEPGACEAYEASDTKVAAAFHDAANAVPR